MRQNKYQNYIIQVSSILILLCCETFMFRNVLNTYTLFGDLGDGRLTNLYTEHWFQWITGKASFGDLPIFFPTTGTIAFSDMFLGFGLVYTVLRFLGIDMFLSFKLTVMTVHALGTFGTYVLLKRNLHTSIPYALLGTICFSFSSTYQYVFEHTQLVAMSAVPFFCIFLLGFINNFYNRVKRNVDAILAITCVAFIAYTAWYITFFSFLFLLLTVLIYVVIRFANDRVSFFEDIKSVIKNIFPDFFGYIIYFGVIMIPFIKLYIPVLQMSGGYDYMISYSYQPELVDIINVTTDNFMIGDFLSYIGVDGRCLTSEQPEGFNLILLVCFVVSFIYLCQRRNKIKYGCGATERNTLQKNIISLSVCYAILVSIILIVRLGSNGISLWRFVCLIVPGASSIRAISRYLFWLSFPMAVVTAFTLDSELEFKNKRLIACILIVLVFLFNIREGGLPANWNRYAENDFINNVVAPPCEAESFYIIDSSHVGDPDYKYQVDAFEIATVYNLPTINGYSGVNPVGWDGIWSVNAEEYETNVICWALKHDLHSVYAYDLAKNEWIPMEERVDKVIDTCVDSEKGRYSISKGIYSNNPGEYEWTTLEYSVLIKDKTIEEKGLKLELVTQQDYYDAQNPDNSGKLQIAVNGQQRESIDVINGQQEVIMDIEKAENDLYFIELKTDCYFNPAQLQLSEDNRDLSIGISYIGVNK